jgi:hypothetical protein
VKIQENLTKYDHFSKYYELKNLLRYETNLTYYEFHICLTIRFHTTVKKPITPTLNAKSPQLHKCIKKNSSTLKKTLYVVYYNAGAVVVKPEVMGLAPRSGVYVIIQLTANGRQPRTKNVLKNGAKNGAKIGVADSNYSHSRIRK